MVGGWMADKSDLYSKVRHRWRQLFAGSHALYQLAYSLPCWKLDWRHLLSNRRPALQVGLSTIPDSRMPYYRRLSLLIYQKGVSLSSKKEGRITSVPANTRLIRRGILQTCMYPAKMVCTRVHDSTG